MPIKSTQKILVIEDDPAFRDAAVAALDDHLPEGFTVIAPDNLCDALRKEVLRDVVIALIDKSIAEYGYQSPYEIGRDEVDESVRGWQVARRLRAEFSNIYLICFSRANFGEMNGYVNDFFLGKLGFLDPTTKEATAEGLRVVIKKAIEIVSARA